MERMLIHMKWISRTSLLTDSAVERRPKCCQAFSLRHRNHISNTFTIHVSCQKCVETIPKSTIYIL